MKIGPSKDIKIYQENNLLYEGILNYDKPNIIFLKSKTHYEKTDFKHIEKNILKFSLNFLTFFGQILNWEETF